MQCSACGQINHAEWYFCASCGGSLDTVRVARQHAPPVVPPAAHPAVPALWPPHQPTPLQPSPPTGQRMMPAPFQPAAQPAYGMAMPVQPTLQPIYGGAAPCQITVSVHTHVTPMAPVIVPAAPPVLIGNTGGAPAFLLRIVWFLCIGLWLGMLTTLISWALIVSVLGLPLGVMLLNRLPQIMTLRPPRQHLRIEPYAGGYALHHGGPPQHPLLARGIYFLAAGWWISALWLMAAWGFAGLTFGLGLPVAFWMFNQVGAVTTLARH